MNKQTLTYIAVGLGFTILLILILGNMFGWFTKGKLKLVEGEGEVDRLSSGAVDYSRYNSIARMVKDNLSGTTVQTGYFKAVADSLLPLNNNELRVVSNIYLTDLGTKENPTLRSIIQGELVGAFGFCSESEKQTIGDNCYYKEQIIKRLNQINA